MSTLDASHNGIIPSVDGFPLLVGFTPFDAPNRGAPGLLGNIMVVQGYTTRGLVVGPYEATWICTVYVYVSRPSLTS